jgi:methylenetetrahydrofolate dehydrogenase (NADP+)/methenyltetrahydrofolate cyclohydrolase
MSEPVTMYGKEVADNMLKDFKAREGSCLYIFSNQADPASKVYVNNKKKKCEELGVPCVVYDISNATYSEVERELGQIVYKEYLKHPRRYVIIQKPLPKQLQEFENYIDIWFKERPSIDIDAFDGDLSTEFKTPATPLGIIKMLDYYVGLDKLDGMNAVVIGRSKIVGKPMADLLLKYNCTVTVCHSHTKDLSLYTKNADLIVSAVGKAKFLTEEYIGDNKPIVVDVGINRDENGKLCGDVDFESVAPKCSFISPVPKGVGVLTVASLVYKMGENVE